MSEATTLPPAFGRWLKRLRAQHDFTQERLAEAAFCSVQAIRSFENGKRRPSLEMAERLAEVLQVPADQQEDFIRLARRATVAAPIEESPTILPPVALTPSPAAPPPLRVTTPLIRLIGREAECAILRRLLVDEQRRLVTLFGLGGSGKTQLALHLAHEVQAEFSRGAAFVPLAALLNGADLPATIAEALGVQLSGAVNPLEQLVHALQGQTILLVLDNFEHLLAQGDEAAAIVATFLQQLPSLHLLVTSRERLRLASEHVFELSGLSAPVADAVEDLEYSGAARLFVTRAQQVVHDFAVTSANAAAIARICTLLDGMPLALEMAAAWARLLPAEEIAAEIARSLDFLALSERGAPARHRNVRAVFDYSWALLTPAEQAVAMRLAVLRGGFDRAAARAIADAGLPLLAALVDKSFVRTIAPATNAAQSSQRYDIHELLRQYLWDQLQAAGEDLPTSRRHADYFAAFAEAIEPRLYAQDALALQQQLEGEQGNLRAALDWSLRAGHDGAIGVRLAGALGRYWYLAGHWSEGRAWLQQALAVTKAEPRARARALVALGELNSLHGDQDAAQACLEEGLAYWTAVQDAAKIAWTRFHLGNVKATRGHFQAAEDHFAASLELYRDLGDRWGQATVLNQLGNIASARGDYGKAAAVLTESLPLVRALQRPGGIAVSLNILGRAFLGNGKVARAIEHFEEALAILQQRNNPAGIAWTQINLGLAHLASGAAPAAQEHFQLALGLYQQLASEMGLVAALAGLAAAYADRSDLMRAVQLLAAVERLREQGGHVFTRYEMEMLARTRAQCEAGFDPGLWQQIWAGGARLSLDEAINLAS